MKKSIPKNNTEYNDVSPDQLSYHTLSKEEETAITGFVEKYNKKNKNGILILMIVELTLVFLCLYNCLIDPMLISLCIIFAIVLLLLWKKQLPSAVHIKYIETGKLNSKWSLRGTGTDSDVYYFDVIFPESGNHIRKVKCIKSEYYSAKYEEGILVFSFNGKSAYGCKTNQN